MYDGTRPTQKLVYQYSLHVMKKTSDKLKHFEYLAKHNKEPRREAAERLIENIKKDNGSIIIYNKGFEMFMIISLVEDFSDIKSDFLALNTRMVDLLDVFRYGYVYYKDMGGSFSIKKTLPALFPNEAGLNYKSLENVQNGIEAQKVFLSLVGKIKKNERS